MSSQGIVPGRFDPRFARVFAWYTRRLIRKRFHGMRILRADTAALAALEGHRGPAIVLMNHPSWWDPLVGVVLATNFTPTRVPCAPIDRVQLERFGFFRRLGLFGIDPLDSQGAAAMAGHVLDRFEQTPRSTLWITPQGRFTDVRRPIELRAGAALIAAKAEEVAAVAVAVEYVFWEDQRPEILLAAEPVQVAKLGDDSKPRRAVPVWHRAMVAAMERASQRLAEAAIARNPQPFESLLGGDAPRINPIYDLWLRLRGRHGAVVDAARSAEAVRSGGSDSNDRSKPPPQTVLRDRL